MYIYFCACRKGTVSPLILYPELWQYLLSDGLMLINSIEKHDRLSVVKCDSLLFKTLHYMYLTLFRRAVVSYWRKYVHEELVNRLGGLSLPRKSVVRLTDRPDMTLDVYCGRKTTLQQQKCNKIKRMVGLTV